MVSGAMDHVTEMLNWFSALEKKCCTVLPAMFIDGYDKLDLSNNQIHFGGYAQIWVGNTNTLK